MEYTEHRAMGDPFVRKIATGYTRPVDEELDPTELINHLRTLSDRQLETRLQVVRIQIERAYEMQLTDALNRLRMDEDCIIAERLRRLDAGGP